MSHPQATETVEEAGDTEAELSRASSEFLRERFYSIAGPEDEHTEMQSAADQDKVSGDAAAAGNNLIRRTQSEVDGMNRDLSDLLRRRVPNQTDSVPLSTKEEMTDAICGLLYRILQSEQQLPNPAQGDTAVEDSCAVPDSGVQVAEEGDAVPKLTGLLDLLRLLCKYDEIPSSTQLSRIVDVADAICSLLSGWIYEEGGFGVFSAHFEILGCRDSGEGNNAVIKFAALRPKLPSLSWIVFVVFRGTLTKEDWLRDISCWPITDETSGIRVHQGMMAAAQDCYDSWAQRGLKGVQEMLCDVPAVAGGELTVYLTGHSLGGGIAHAMRLLTRSRPVDTKRNAFSFHVTTFGSPLVFQDADESPDHFPREEVQANLDALHTKARNYVSCHDLIPRILCCRDENLERLKKILVDAGKEHAKNSAWAIWMVVEGRAEQAISGVIEGIMNILRSVSRQGKYVLVGELLNVCLPKACFLKDPGADFYKFRMDSPWEHFGTPDKLVDAAFLDPTWLEQIPETTNIKRAVKGHSMSGYTEALVGVRPPWLHEIIQLDNLSHEPARLSEVDNFLTGFFRLTPAVVRNLRSMELIAAAAQFGPAYDYDDTCNAVLVETAMNVNTMRRHLRNDAANLKCDAAKPALYSDVASPKIDQLKDVAKKILQTEQRNSSELLSALTVGQREMLDRNRRIGMQVVNTIEAAKKNGNPGAVIMAMSSRHTNPGVMAKGAYALVSLAEGNKAKMKDLLDRDGPGGGGNVEAVVEWLAAVKTIIQTQQSRVGSGAIREVVGLVVESMRSSAQHGPAQAQGCAVLSSIAMNAEYHPRLATENCISLLILTMSQHRTDPEVQENAVLALCRLAGNQDLPLKARIGSEGGIAAVVEAMKAHPKLPAVQEQGSLTLCLLSDDTECADAMQRETSGVREVVAGAFKHVGSARVQEHGGELNGRLGLALSPAELATSAIEASRERRDTEAILRAMREQTYQVNVQRHGFAALAAIMAPVGPEEQEEKQLKSVKPEEEKREEKRRREEEASAVAAIINGLKQHLDNPAVQLEGCEVLGRLARRQGLRAKIGQEGGIAALVDAMKAHPDAAQLQEQACAALNELCNDCIENESMKYELGGIKAAVVAMRLHGSNRGVVQQASLVMGWGGLGDEGGSAPPSPPAAATEEGASLLQTDAQAQPEKAKGQPDKEKSKGKAAGKEKEAGKEKGAGKEKEAGTEKEKGDRKSVV